MVRSLAMLAALGLAYGLLRGHPESWPAVVRGCLAVLLLVAGIGIWGRRRKGGGQVVRSRRRAVWADYVAVGAAVLSVEFLFVVFFSAAPRPLESMAGGLEEWLRPAAAAERDEEEAGRQGRGEGNWLWDDERRRDLPRRTNFQPGIRPEVFLRPETAADEAAMLETRLYVQAFALSRYRGRGWSVAPDGSRELAADNDGWLRLGGERPGAAVACRVFHGAETSGQNPVSGLQGMVAARVPGAVELDPGLRLLPNEFRTVGGFEYDTISRPWTLDQVDEAAGAGEGAAAEWSALPSDELSRRVRTVAREAAGSGPEVAKLKRLRDHLRTSYDYSLVTENPDDRDPLENFLFHERRGHCEFFATAGALMARATGVPARVGYGWLGGTYYESSRLFVFRAREAHAWVEVWLEGYGWVVMDPTPPVGLARTVAERAPAGEEAPEMVATEPVVAETGEAPWRGALVLAAVFGLPGLLLQAWRGRRRGNEPLAGGGVIRAGYLRAFVAECRTRGVGMAPGWTLRRVVAELEDKPGFTSELIRYHYGVVYEGKHRDGATETALLAEVRAWQASRT